MVDTIVIRVHDLRRHEQLVNELNTNFKGTTKNTIYVPPEDSEMIRRNEIFDAKDYIDFWHNPRTGTHLVHYSSQKKMNTSGHYYLNASVNYDRDFVEFNFSVPKYVFGTNILMFCEHYWDKNFKYFYNSSLDYNFKKTHKLLMGFISGFFKNEFLYNDIVDYHLVEINRIDLAFNQVFDCKKFALDYLEYQKKLRKRHLRAESNSFRAYDTSLMYSTKRYSFKIYHKGTEYKKKDRNEHERINKEKGRDYFDIDELQSFSDKILRYEVTFRDSMLSYIFNNKLFRKKCPIHKGRYEIYKKVESAKQKNDTIASVGGSFKTSLLRDAYKASHPFIEYSKEEDVVHKKMTKLLNRKRQFLLKTYPSVEEYNSKTISSGFEPRALFSYELVKECSRFFKSLITDFQLSLKPADSVVKERIVDYNKTNRDQLPKNQMLMFYMQLINSSFEELMKTGVYSRATFYRYKKRFEKIGITQNNILPIDYMHSTVDLSMYHHHIFYNKNLINR